MPGLGRENLRAAFPEKSDVEIEQILAGVWDNLGRIAVEFAHLDEFCVEGVGRQTPDVITSAPEATERYRRMLDRGKPMLGLPLISPTGSFPPSQRKCSSSIPPSFIGGRISGP